MQAGAGENIGGGCIGAGQDADSRGLHSRDDLEVAGNNFFAEGKIRFGTMFEPLVNSVLPNLTFVLRNIFNTPVAQQVGLRCHESKMNDDGEGGNLPGIVGDEGAKKSIGLLRGVGIEKLALPGARARKRLFRRHVRRIGAELLFAQFVFFAGAGKEDAGEMLDAGLAGLGRLESGDAVGDVADKTNVALPGFVSDGQVGFAREARLRFDEIDALTDKKVDSVAGFCGIFYNDGGLVARRFAVKIGAGEKDLRPGTVARFDFAAQLRQAFHFSTHVANRGDAVGDEKREDEFAAAGRFSGTGEVKVHVGEAGNKEFAGGVEDLGAARNAGRRRGTDRSDVLIGNQDGPVRLWNRAGGINDRDMRDGEIGTSLG